MKLYAIPNCDTFKKARKWLEEQGLSYEFHDYKKHGADVALLGRACTQFGWEQVVNRKGMTWRKMDDVAKAAITDDASAIALMQEKTSVIKRPILEHNEALLLGFDEKAWQETLL
jgi:arsenate reductase